MAKMQGKGAPDKENDDGLREKMIAVKLFRSRMEKLLHARVEEK